MHEHELEQNNISCQRRTAISSILIHIMGCDWNYENLKRNSTIGQTPDMDSNWKLQPTQTEMNC